MGDKQALVMNRTEIFFQTSARKDVLEIFKSKLKYQNFTFFLNFQPCLKVELYWK